MSQRYEKLKTLLKKLFQLDQPDLDFGLYRVMHAKSDEVSQFLDEDLLPQVRDAFDQYKTADKAELEKELSKVIAGIEAGGMNPDNSPKVKELRTQLQSDAVDIAALESEVYDHLYTFFRRYYSEGDFLAKRVYKSGVYAIPYEGEEVTLHWANKDQYYIKTSEYLRDYAFRLRPDDENKPMRVHFRLMDAAEGEHGSVKAAEGKNRVFILAAPEDMDHAFVAEENSEQGRELVIRFEYRPATLTDWPENRRTEKKNPPKQKDLITFATERILTVANPAFAEWLTELGKTHTLASGDKAEYSRLKAHLNRYTARNTFDYFIHKNLGTFLRRELDFYIKNEVMHLDDVENESVPRVEQYLSKIKVIRRIAGKIIDFLAQLEDFQKKLWLKKKFVVETRYCITVGSIPEEFYPEIAANNAQHEEWVNLFAIDEINGDLTTPAYSEKLKPEFLKANPTLVVDTRHFDVGFTGRLLEAMGDMDEQTDGLLFHGDNFQALSVMQARHREQVKCIHIDPPYNTDTSGFLYKNDYQHSSWLAMMENRALAAVSLMARNGSFLCHIDENEYERLHMVFGSLPIRNAGTVIWDKRNPMTGGKGIAIQHEYLIWRSNSDTAFNLRNNSISLLLAKAKEVVRRNGGVTQRCRKEFSKFVSTNPELSGGEKAYRFLDEDGRVYQSVSLRAPEPRQDRKFFIPLMHPQTGYPCPVPPNGFSRTPETLKGMLDRGEIVFGKDHTTQPRQKRYLSIDSSRQLPSVIQDATRGKSDLKKLNLEDFPYCHSVRFYAELLGAAAPGRQDLVLDYFAGSGTTGHAAINLNREDGGQRKFILVEMGDYFDSVLLPRIKKLAFTPEWKDGKPKRLATSKEADRGPRIVKVVRLESYEDTLNNLDTHRTNRQADLLDSAEAQGADGLREQYILRYMLDVETCGSQSLLNIRAFVDPTAYKLKIKRPGSDESQEVNVDLLETFNWLIGLTVRHIATPQTFSVAFHRDSENRLRLKDRLKQEDDGLYWFRTVTGTTPDGRRTLVIWRKLTGEPEQDNLVLDEWFTRQGYSAKDSEFDLIYVNGGNNLENLKTPDDLWKVRLIEEDFHRLMFEMEEA